MEFPSKWVNQRGLKAICRRTLLIISIPIVAFLFQTILGPAPSYAATLQVTTGSLPGGTVAIGYGATLSATGGTPPYTWSLASGNLPTGLKLSSSGTFSGTPTTVGSYSFTIQVNDAGGDSVSRAFSISIAPLVSILTASVPNSTVGLAYSATLTASGGTHPYTWSLAAGSLPAGLTLSTSGTLSGTPTTAGSYSITVEVNDSGSHPASKAFSMSITSTASALSMVTTSLPNGTVGQAYSATLAASGGTQPYTWSLASGQLPIGLSLNASGIASGASTTAGSYSFTLQVNDAGGHSASQAFSVSIAPLVSIVTASLPNGTVGQAYSATLAASGGTQPYTWSLVSGQLPTGLSLSASGITSGTPTTAGSYSFTVEVNDSGSHPASKAFSMSTTSTASALSIVTTSLSNGTVGQVYSATLAASGGTQPYTWSLVSGQLPTGLSLSASGITSGTPTAAGSYTFTLQVNDSGGRTASRSYSASITSTSPTAALSPASFSFASQPVATTSSAESFTLSNSGNAALSIAGIGVTGTDPGDFIQNTTCGATLAPNGTCTIAVLFTPAGAGTRSGKLVVTDNSNNTAGSTQSSTLAGTGAHDVVLTWNASTSAGILGYNIYRGSTAGGESITPLNSTPVNAISYVDNTVTAGSTYYYRVTAVETGGTTQTSDSNEASATVPTP